MSITSDEVNYLIYRYLVESGFNHSSFSFGYETAIHNIELKERVPQGALISLLQKGLLYTQVEVHLLPDGREKKCIAPYSLLGTHECQIVKDDPDSITENQASSASNHHEERKRKRKKRDQVDSATHAVVTANGASPASSVKFKESQVKILTGHESEVFRCEWNPEFDLIASGSADGTARIWSIPDDPTQESTSILLDHVHVGPGPPPDSRDVMTLDWSSDGQLLATGSCDGLARVWLKTGELKYMYKKHVGPVFAVKWNKTGSLLLTCCLDRTAIIWDSLTGEPRQTFAFHQGPVTDVDWMDETTFASCSADKKIYVCQLGSLAPLKQFEGHEDEVNNIRWDPSGTYLASSSDDRTAKVWTMDKLAPFWVLAKDMEIYSTRWSPKTDKNNIWLATASFDGGVRVWDILSGNCLFNLVQHKQPVYTTVFSSDCNFLASGSFDKCVHIWSLKTGKLLKSFTGTGGIFQVDYSRKNDKLAASFSDKKVVVLSLAV